MKKKEYKPVLINAGQVQDLSSQVFFIPKREKLSYTTRGVCSSLLYKWAKEKQTKETKIEVCRIEGHKKGNPKFVATK